MDSGSNVGQAERMTVAVNEAPDACVSSKRKFCGPIVRLSRYLNKVLLPVVTGEHSIAMVANFQRLCGLQADGKVTNHVLNIYFRTASTCGEEIFTFMPLVFWVAFPVALSFLTNFLFLQISGQLTKDFFRLPRPISPPGSKNPIIKLDNHFDTEYGLPSTHTIAGLLPATTLLILLRHGVPISTGAWVGAFIYWISVAFSRLYLGVHSVYDVVAGALLGSAMMGLLHVYGDSIDVLAYQCSAAVYVQVALLALYFVAYPRSGPWSASFGTAAQMMGPFFGCGISLWYLFNHNLELRDTLLHASMVNPRPYVLQSLAALTDSAVEGANALAQNTVLGVMSTLATNGRELVAAGADEWMKFNTEYGAAVAPTGASGAYEWYNTHPESFNALPAQRMAYRLLAAAAAVGFCKVFFKVVPALVCSALCNAGVTKVAKVQQQDCFGRDVPLNKAYVVEIPVRIINYASLGVATILVSPYLWNRYGL